VTGVSDRVQRRVVRLRVTGRVQGVGFRWFVREAAQRCGVTGDVRNLDDGAVEIRAAGSAEQLEQLASEVRGGPPGARVSHVERVDLDPAAAFTDFRIRD
jgi:acylphosphatase